MFYKIWQLKHMLADYLKHISEELKILHIQLRCLAIDTGSGTLLYLVSISYQVYLAQDNIFSNNWNTEIDIPFSLSTSPSPFSHRIPTILHSVHNQETIFHFDSLLLFTLLEGRQ